MLSLPVAGFAKGDGAPLSQADMLDARVNYKQVYYAATEGRESALQSARAALQRDVAEITTAVRDFERTHPTARIAVSSLTGAPTSVSSTGAPLTPASGAGTRDIVMNFLRNERRLYGLSSVDIDDLFVLGESGDGDGLRMLRLEQRIAGRPVFQSETRFLIDRAGRIVKSTGQMIPQGRSRVDAFDPGSLISAPEAVVKLLASAGKQSLAASFTLDTQEDGQLRLSESDEFVAGPITAREVLFPLAPGLLVPAWSLVVFTSGEQDWYAVVDARGGQVLWRKNIRSHASQHNARFRVYVQADGVTPADNPAPQSPNTAIPGSGTQFPEIAPTIVSMHTAMNSTASPNGWIDDCPAGGCTINETQTLGNNVLACLDRSATANVCDTDANSMLDGNGRPTGNPDANGRNRDFLGTTPRDFQSTFLPPPQLGNPESGQTATGIGVALDVFRRAATTQLFYTSNWYHDRLHALGFDEGAGNFQQTNFSGSGLGNDRVLADVQDVSGTNNANFSTPPDGTSGRMQMFRFTGPTIDRDSSLDAEIVLHELTHGTSNRLIGNGAGLNWEIGRGLGEGWSDFYALSLLNATNADAPNGQYASGSYSTYKLGSPAYLDNYVYGIRRFPYSTDNSINPLTWADVDDVTNNLSGGIAPSPLAFNDAGGAQVHNAGELWALSLWEVRARVIADPAGAGGNVPTGNQTMLQLVTDALKMTPIDPSYTDARDALFDADCATNACANEQSIWAGFADRGLGYGASAPFNALFGYTAGHIGIRESFSLPHLDVVDVTTDVTIDDTDGNGNGSIDPGEPIRLSVRLTNPWRGAARVASGVTATLSSSTPGVTVYGSQAVYPDIAPQLAASGDSFLITVSPSAVCGSAIDFVLTVSSNQGTTAVPLRLRVGTANGTDPVVTYTHAADLGIVDNRGRAVFNQMTISEDFEIADLDFRVDSLTHTYTGDLSLMLRSPTGIGIDLISLIGGLVGGGAGDNMTNMVIDDDLPIIAANDMVQAVNAAAPYSRSWLPVFNAPWPALAGYPGNDPVGTLARYDGSSTRGTWSVAVSDQQAGDVGTLHSWSLLVTPVRFACTPFVANAAVSATKTVAGSFRVGGTVAYTVVVTNTGGAGQADNPGNEFVDILPSALTLVSASATSGTAVADIGTNTVTWNGALAPLGGSATITIVATINAGTPLGTLIANQGVVAFDADGNGSNESTDVTDDPTLPGAGDATTFNVAFADLSARKTVSGTFVPGSTVTYVVLVANNGNAPSSDNPGNELVDVLPSALDLVNATASSGTAVANTGTNTLTWNGGIAAGGSATITITATIQPGATGTISNQATLSFDADLDGVNETSRFSDDPAVGGTSDPTSFLVRQGVLTVAPVALAFGNQPVGTTSSALTVTLGNSGNADLQVTGLGAPAAPFARVAGGSCAAGTPFVIAAGAQCTVLYTFAPTATGAATQTLAVSADVGNAQSVTLSGTGTQGALTLGSATLAFGNQPVGTTSSALTVTLGNSGNADLQVTGLGAPAAPFARVAGGSCAAGTPFVIAAGAQCTVLYTFAPTATGAATQTLAVSADVGNAQSVTLSGTGTQGALTLGSATLAFGNQPVGTTSSALTVTLGNSGNADLQVTGLGAPAAPFARVAGGSCAVGTPFVIAAGAQCTVLYTFAPTATGAATQTLTVTPDVGNSQTIALSGTGTQGALTLGSATLAFGNQVVGTTSGSLTVTLGNSGNADLQITALDAPAAPFARVAGGSCAAGAPFVIAAGAQCTVLYTFAPTATGAATQTLAVSADVGNAQSVTLSGTGTQGALTLGPATLAFGNHPVGTTSGSLTATLGNSGDADLQITALDAPTAPFARVAGGSCAAVTPFVIAAGAQCTVLYTFAPTAAGAATQTLAVSADVGSPQSLTLSGTGTQGILTLGPAALAFGNHPVGTTSGTLTATLGNSGDADLQITALQAPTAPFARIAGGSCAAGTPFVIAAGAQCTVLYSFAPTVSGPVTQTLVVTSNAGSDQNITLSGTGTLIPPIVIPTLSQWGAMLLAALFALLAAARMRPHATRD